MQTFESGGALLIAPRKSLKTIAAACGLALTALSALPVLGAYLLLVA